MRCALAALASVARQLSEGGACRLLFGVAAGASPSFSREVGRQGHRAVEAARVAVLLADLLAAVIRQSKTFPLAPLLQGGLAVDAVGVRQHCLSTAAPVGRQPLLHRIGASNAIHRTDQRFAEVSANGGGRGAVAAGLGADAPPAVDLQGGA